MSGAPETPPIVVLLGFHRSGTSMVTRMLNLLGVGLGDEAELLPPTDRDNPNGYWEPRWMNELNEELLATLGSGTFEPFAAEPGWERSPQLEPLRKRARALLAEHFAGETQWGWKDPRTSLTLPFWREVVEGPLACVVCVRSPADAVASALRRGVVDIHRWHYAERWFEYTHAALAGTSRDERMLVFYEDVLRQPEREAHRLASFVGIEDPADERIDAAVASVDPALRHHMTSPWDVAVDPGLPLEARALYLLLRTIRTLEPSSDPSGERLPEALERIGAELGAARRDTAAERLRTLQEIEALRSTAVEQAERLQAEVRERDAAIAQRDERIVALDASLTELEQQLAELRGVLAERDAALDTITRSRSWRLTRPLRAAGRHMRRGEVRTARRSDG